MVFRLLLPCLMFSIVTLPQTATAALKTAPVAVPAAPAHTQPTQHKISGAVHKQSNEELFFLFARPIEFTPQGIEFYLKHIYNHEEYPEFLAENITAFAEFLQFGKTQNQDSVYAQSIIKLFLQKMKACPCINAYAFLQALQDAQEPLTYFLEKKEQSWWKTVQQNIKKTLTDTLSRQFTFFQKEPDKFLTDLSCMLAQETDELHINLQVHSEQVRKDMVRFIELATNKIVWDPHDAYQAWLHVNKIAHVCYQYYKHHIISDIESFDDICWSLVHRFSYFLKLSIDQIDALIITQMIHDIQTKELALLSVEEQEDFIISKKEHLLKKLATLRTKK